MDKITLLKDIRGNLLYPKILSESIPDKAINKTLLNSDVTSIFDGLISREFLSRSGTIAGNGVNAGLAFDTGVYPWCTEGCYEVNGGFTLIVFRTKNIDNYGYYTIYQIAFGREEKNKYNIFCRLIRKNDSEDKTIETDWVEISSKGIRDSLNTEVLRALAAEKKNADAIAVLNGDLVHDMEQWNNRIAALESDKLTSKVVIYASDVIEYIPNNSSSYITIQLQNANGIISKDVNYTHKHLYYNINNKGEVDVQDDNANVEYKYNAPEEVNITARGTATYKGVPITFPLVSKTIYAVLPSYIGYIEDYNNWNNTGTKLIKHSLNGQYDITNSFDLAYLIVAIPKNGMVLPINSIIQKGTLDAAQQYDVIDKGNYTLYVCRTRHIKGSYTFAVS